MRAAEILPYKEPRSLAGLSATASLKSTWTNISPHRALPMIRTARCFAPTGRKTGIPQRMARSDAYLMIERRARQAGITTKIGTGITDYLKSDGSLAEARKTANHADIRTTQLYDRPNDEASLDQYEKVGI